ncbi:MAG: pentapeptide repeat-containing protein [Candidatus Zixiibacteriota bacterium]
MKDISIEELKQRFDYHKRWLNGDEALGVGVCLADLDLSKFKFDIEKIFDSADLSHSSLNGLRLIAPSFKCCNLAYTDFGNTKFPGIRKQAYTEPKNAGVSIIGPEFTGANLSCANFNNSEIEYGIFNNSILDGCTFYNAKLKDCDFSNAKGLHASLFAGADLTGTKLPAAIANFEAKGHAEKLAQITKRAFFALLLACVFSCLSIANTFGIDNASTDYTTPLPVLGTTIPFSWLYMALPVLLMAMNLYFTLFFQRYTETVGTLPANFEDGRPLHRVLEPWVFSSMLYSYIPLFINRKLPLKRLQHTLSVFLGWWIVPMSLFLLGFRLSYISDLSQLIIIGIFITLSIHMNFYTFRLSKNTLMGKPNKLEIDWKVNLLKQKSFWIHSSPTFITILLLAGIILYLRFPGN